MRYPSLSTGHLLGQRCQTFPKPRADVVKANSLIRHANGQLLKFVGCRQARLARDSLLKGTDDTLFLLELQYGGIFKVEGVPEEQLHPFLSIECPRMLFPYVRRLVADITREGGFPALNLENIDFMQIYRKSIAQRAQAEATKTEAPRAN